MLKRWRALLVIVAGVCFVYGCGSFRYPPVEKKLFARQILKHQVDSVKSKITANGYERISKDNYYSHNMGAIVTQYEKAISTTSIGTSNKVHIMLNFKEVDAPNGYYRNLGLTITNIDQNDIPEINEEVDRIERILYETLIEVSGKTNVVRGVRENTKSGKPWEFYTPNVPPVWLNTEK